MIAHLLQNAALQQALHAVDPARLTLLAIDVQQIAAPTFDEAARAAFVAKQLASFGLADVETDDLQNVYARYPSRGDRRPILVSAHTDTVFPFETDLSIRRETGRVYGPGLGDNSLGVAGLLWLAELLVQNEVQFPGDLWLVANVGEEGLGDLRGIRQVIDRLGDEVAATIVVEGLAFGYIYHAGIAVRRYCVQAKTGGGHSWLHYGRPSAVHGLAQLTGELATLQLPSKPRTTLNIGKLVGGTSVNTIANSAEFELDLRSEDAATLLALCNDVETLIAAAEEKYNLEIKSEICGDRPAGNIPADHPLVQLASTVLKYVGVDKPILERGSTDANIPLSRGYPAVTVGLSRGGNTHRPDEFVELQHLRAGMEQLLLLVFGAYSLQAG